jgi:hypothetical protein
VQVKTFNKEFVNVDNSELFELILAANFLNIRNLLEITCQAVADQIRGKNPEQIRERFGIEVCITKYLKAACVHPIFISWIQVYAGVTLLGAVRMNASAGFYDNRL